MYDVTKNHLSWVPNLLNDLPKLKAFMTQMEARPNMAKYLASDEHMSIPITPTERLP